MALREGYVKRRTMETDVEIGLKLDGSGSYKINTPIPFLNHMLEQLAKHGFFDLSIEAKGDVEVDFHHTVEDIGMCLGEAFHEALKDKKGIARFGSSTVPMDEALASVHVDFCGRSYLVYNADIHDEKIGRLYEVAMTRHFFQPFANKSEVTVHINLHYGDDPHHCLEAIFKAFGKALHQATRLGSNVEGVLSTKGVL